MGFNKCKCHSLKVTKEELKNYMDYGDNIRSIEDEILVLRTNLERVTPRISDSPMGGNKDPDKMTMPIHHLCELENELERVMVRKLSVRLRIEKAIEVLLTEREQKIVRYRYFEGMKWVEICVKMNYEWAQTHRLHARLLMKLEHPKCECKDPKGPC